MQYRRAFVAAGTYFFTVNLLQRDKSLLTDHIDLLRNAFRRVKLTHPFDIDAMVVLPDHLHAIWTLPENDFDFATRWRLIKSHFSHGIPLTERINASRRHKSERGIWQRRYWEHLIRDDLDYSCHIDYIHYNPVKHGYVDKAVDWPYSSIHRFVGNGMITNDWGVDDVLREMPFGE
ncbi:transposase IS200-family protein [Methylophaga lonarensis MPL]|uniref:Transposase IS200-family protein n=2 Tax=Methylophaga lonarensis TaxID=999151 RepID=M7PFN3_9GAMM|nr:transposase IS200-family protein [Methylophaga lonarensis MPL]